MFSGIITQIGNITEIDGSKLTISADKAFVTEISSGSSIAVNGVCLTALEAPSDNTFTVEFIPETAKKTNIESLGQSDKVNLELALPASARLDGHIVQGHVDGVGTITKITPEKNSHLVDIELPKDIAELIIEKGSVTLNGVSLTIISINHGTLKVGIIPYTWKNTIFHELKTGDTINVEVDVLARYAQQMLKQEKAVNDITINEPKFQKVAEANLPTEFGTFQMSVYENGQDNKEHVALRMGYDKNSVLTRVHSQCLTGDTFHSLKCDCKEQLHQSFQMIAENGSGIIIYLDQEGRDIGLTNKIKAYALQEQGMDTVEANVALGLPIDNRNYQMVVDILTELEVESVRLISNSSDKQTQLEKLGVTIDEVVSIQTIPQQYNRDYLKTKQSKMGHHFDEN